MTESFSVKNAQKLSLKNFVVLFLLTKLVNELGYAPEKIEIEHEYTAGRPHTITSRIDVIVRDANGDAFLFIEVKTKRNMQP